MSFLGKVKKKLRNGSWYPFYNTFYEKNNLDPHMILLESRSGKALESNILSLLKELCQEPIAVSHLYCPSIVTLKMK